MKISKTLFAKVKHFCRDTTASLVFVVGGAMPVVIVTGGVGLDLMSVQIQENAAASQLNSAGIFASQINACSGIPAGSNLTACVSQLTSVVNSYIHNSNPSLTATLTPGLWCGNTFTSNSSCPNGSGVSAVKLTGTLSYNTRFLKLVGLSSINRQIQLTMMNSKVTAVATTNICPSIILNEQLLVSPTAGNVAWNDQASVLRNMGRYLLRINAGQQYGFSGTNGTLYTSNSFWMASTDGSNRSSYPNSERLNNTPSPIPAIDKPSGNVFDFTAGTRFTVWSNNFPANSNEFGKTVNDPDYGLVNASDNGGPQIFAKLKRNYEGKTCMAMVGHDNGDGTVTVSSGIPITIDVICDGKRKSIQGKWYALKDDGVTAEPRCTYTSDTDKVDPSIAFWFGEGRTSDTASYTPSDSTKWAAQVNGDYSKGSAKSFNAPAKKVADVRSYY